MFGINGGEFIVLLVIAAIVIGPERLPGYAEQFANFVRSARAMFTSAKDRVDSELSEELGGEVDWAALDPRRYDPRRIVRDALIADDDAFGLGELAGTLNRKAAGPGASASALFGGIGGLAGAGVGNKGGAGASAKSSPAAGASGARGSDSSARVAQTSAVEEGGGYAGAAFDDEAT